MKRRTALAILAVSACLFSSVSVMAEEAVAETEVVEEVFEESTESGVVYEVEELGTRPEYIASEHVTLGDYTNLAVSVPEATVSDDELDFELQYDIDYLIEEKGLFEKVEEGTVAEGDTANIDYAGTVDGVAFDGGTAQGTDLEIGSGMFIEGFEEQLIGVAVGETVDINVTFPDYYVEDLAGKDAVFTVTINYIKRMPEVTDDLISQLTDGEYTTVFDYREYMRSVLMESAQQTQEDMINEELMTQLYNTCTIDSYPEELIEYSVKEARNQYITMLPAYYGLSYNDFLDMYGMSDEEFRVSLAEMARDSLKQEMILLAIAEAEGMTISEEEYEAGLQEYADTYGFPTMEEFEAQYGREVIEDALLFDKVQDFIRENAVITYTEPETYSEDELEFYDDVIEGETDDIEVIEYDEAAVEGETE